MRSHTDRDCLDMYTFCPAPVLYLVLGLFQCPKHGLGLEIYGTQLSVLHVVMLIKSYLVLLSFFFGLVWCLVCCVLIGVY